MKMEKRQLMSIVIISILLLFSMSAWAAGTKEDDGKVTLRYWFQTEKIHKDIIEEFEKQHPNIKIEGTEIAHDRMNQVLNNALASGEGPDLMYSNLGVNVMGPVMKAGRVMDLTNIAEERGWFEKLSDFGIGEATHFNKFWAIPNEAEAIVVFYNKEIFNELGVTVPKTWDEFVAILEKVKNETDYEPLAYGLANVSPAHHRVSLAFEWGGGTESVKKAIFEGGPLNTADFIEGMRTVSDLDRKYAPHIMSRTDQEAAAFFLAGDVAMMQTGTWFAGNELTAEDVDRIGIFMPVYKGDDEPRSVAGAGSGWYVATNTEHLDECLAFLEFLMSPDCNRIIVENGYVPAKRNFTVPSNIENPFMREIVDLMANNHFGYFLHHFISASTDDELTAGYQELLAEKISVEEYLNRVNEIHQKDWKEGFRP